MTYTAEKLDSAAMRDSFARQVRSTQIMCAGMEKEREFDESKVKRASGKFATRAEKAKMAEDAAKANAAAVAGANPGVVELPDGTTTYKLSPKEEGQVSEKSKAIAMATTAAVSKAATEPAAAVADLQKVTIASEPKGALPAAKKALAIKISPAKAQAAAQITKAVSANMSDDQVRKGLVAVTKKLNSGKASKPEEVMEMIKDWAAQAQKNIGSGIKAIKSAGSDAKARALAAGTGLMTKIAEMAAAAQNSDAGKAIGNAYNSATKAIGEKVNEAGFSTDIRDLPGDLGQVGKDLAQDAKETADKIGAVVKSPNFLANVGASVATVGIGVLDAANRRKMGMRPKSFPRQIVEHVVVSNTLHRTANALVPKEKAISIVPPATADPVAKIAIKPVAVVEVKPFKPAIIPAPTKLDLATDLAGTIAKAAVTKGLPASVVGAAIGGIAGGVAAGPAGFIAGIPIGRDIDGFAGTMTTPIAAKALALLPKTTD
jgi:hypothetical protein